MWPFLHTDLSPPAVATASPDNLVAVRAAPVLDTGKDAPLGDAGGAKCREGYTSTSDERERGGPMLTNTPPDPWHRGTTDSEKPETIAKTIAKN